jgi:hypothetical protein
MKQQINTVVSALDIQWPKRHTRTPAARAANASPHVRMNRAGGVSVLCIGTKSIESIEVGDQVLAWNEATEVVERQRVVRLFRRSSQKVLEVALKGQCRQLTVTREHPFWRVGRGWVPAQELRPGDELKPLHSGGEVRVESIRQQEAAVDVFNFEVDSLHNYFVGEAAVLAHNASFLVGGVKALLQQGIDLLNKPPSSPSEGISVPRQQALFQLGPSELKTSIDSSLSRAASKIDSWEPMPLGDRDGLNHALSTAPSPEIRLSLMRATQRLANGPKLLEWTRELMYEVGAKMLSSRDSQVRDAANAGQLHPVPYFETLVERGRGIWGDPLILEKRNYSKDLFTAEVSKGRLLFDPYFSDGAHGGETHAYQLLYAFEGDKRGPEAMRFAGSTVAVPQTFPFRERTIWAVLFDAPERIDVHGASNAYVPERFNQDLLNQFQWQPEKGRALRHWLQDVQAKGYERKE